MTVHQREPTVGKFYFTGALPWDPSHFTSREDYRKHGTSYFSQEMTIHELSGLGTVIHYPEQAADYARATLDEVAQALRQMPSLGRLPKVFVVDHVHPTEPELSEDSFIPADYDNDNHGVVLYRPKSGWRLSPHLLFEWFRVVCGSELYLAAQQWKIAQQWEQLHLGATHTAFHAEDWRAECAKLGSYLLSQTDDAALVEACMVMPLRCAILGHAIHAELECANESYEPAESSPQASAFVRAGLIQLMAGHVALKLIKEHDLPAPVHDQHDILKLLEEMTIEKKGSSGRSVRSS